MIIINTTTTAKTTPATTLITTIITQTTTEKIQNNTNNCKSNYHNNYKINTATLTRTTKKTVTPATQKNQQLIEYVSTTTFFTTIAEHSTMTLWQQKRVVGFGQRHFYTWLEEFLVNLPCLHKKKEKTKLWLLFCISSWHVSPIRPPH